VVFKQELFSSPAVFSNILFWERGACGFLFTWATVGGIRRSSRNLNNWAVGRSLFFFLFSCVMRGILLASLYPWVEDWQPAALVHIFPIYFPCYFLCGILFKGLHLGYGIWRYWVSETTLHTRFPLLWGEDIL